MKIVIVLFKYRAGYQNQSKYWVCIAPYYIANFELEQHGCIIGKLHSLYKNGDYVNSSGFT